MIDIGSAERLGALLVIITGALAGIWKLLNDKKNAPIDREKALLDIIGTYTEQLAENQKTMNEMRQVFDSEVLSLRSIIAGLQDRIGILESALRRNSIPIPDPERRATDEKKTKPYPSMGLATKE
jgi:hypothetical protein